MFLYKKNIKWKYISNILPTKLMNTRIQTENLSSAGKTPVMPLMIVPTPITTVVYIFYRISLKSFFSFIKRFICTI
jgi:hypothetical protein